MPNLYEDFEEQFKMVLESIEKSFELCSSVKYWKKESCKPSSVDIKVKNAISRERQGLKYLR